ncbi:hypothetical protein J6590_075932 [Homalodisca vitripennis]|nr:hypothetical protein J6590_075932 [Homalodisca vitripennis]
MADPCGSSDIYNILMEYDVSDYVESEVTQDFLAVEEMRHGSSPEEAAKTAISRIAKYYPTFSGAIITVNIQGDYAASCHGLDSFPYSVHSPQYPSGVVLRASCI